MSLTLERQQCREIHGQWFKKKGSKVGFWHEVYVKLNDNKLSYGKDEKHVKKQIQILPETVIDYSPDQKPPRFSIRAPKMKEIILSSKDESVILAWVSNLREITLRSDQYTMDDFDIISVIGQGYYGKVMLCQEKRRKKIYAIKTVHKARLIKSDKIHTIFAERNILLRVKHPFIVRICFAFQTSTKFYLGLEYVPGGELFKHLCDKDTLPIDEVRLYIAEVALALEYLHTQHIIYRDLKPENVLLDLEGHTKLTDFGLVKDLGAGASTTTFCGTSEYLAPEIVTEKPYDDAIDWWSLGVFTYELLFGETPFHHKNKSKMFDDIVNKDPKFPNDVDPDARDFVLGLLKKKPQDRFNFEQIKAHPFLNSLDFDKVLNKEYKPKYIPPKPKKITELINFDSDFTGMKAQDSIATPVNASFTGFSFVASRYTDEPPPEVIFNKNLDDIKQQLSSETDSSSENSSYSSSESTSSSSSFVPEYDENGTLIIRAKHSSSSESSDDTSSS